MNISLNLVMMTGLSFIPGFELAGIFGAVGLGLHNYLTNYDPKDLLN